MYQKMLFILITLLVIGITTATCAQGLQNGQCAEQPLKPFDQCDDYGELARCLIYVKDDTDDDRHCKEIWYVHDPHAPHCKYEFVMLRCD